MPSFDAPIRVEHGPSRLLALWCGACDLIAVIVVGVASAQWITGAGAISGGLLLLASTVLAGLVIAHHWRCYGHAGRDVFELHADGTLRWISSARRSGQMGSVTLTRCGPFLRLRSARSGLGLTPAWRLYLAVDGLQPPIWRRCCAWSRAGLPQADAVSAGATL